MNALSNHTLVAAPEATTATGAHTAADAIRAVTTWTDLPERRRRDLRAALGVLERASGRPLDLIALEPEAVCVSAWNRDPGGGVIGVQKGPL